MSQGATSGHVTPLACPIKGKADDILGGFSGATSECKHPPRILSGLLPGVFMLVELLL